MDRTARVKPSGVIALLTDFGESDYFVASMKGVILGLFPSAVIVDLSHEVPPFNVRRGAFILWKAYKWFPRGTTFLGVVDPGVGSSRKAILVVGRNYYFVGPDNGLLSPAALEDGVEHVVDLSPLLSRGPASSTFHGRDVFAPAAAMVARGDDPLSLGPPTEMSSVLDFGRASLEGGALRCSIVYVDRFGNAFTSFTGYPPWPLGQKLLVELGTDPRRRAVGTYVRTYSDVGRGEVAVLVNSEGHLELAVREGDFASIYSVSEGDAVSLLPL